MNHFAVVMGLAIATTPLLTAQPSYAQLAQITDIQLIPIEDGLQLVLITADPTALELLQSQDGSTLFIDIAGAQLALPEGSSYQQVNPSPLVKSIAVEQASEQQVRITLVGTDEAPNAYLERVAEALILDIVTASAVGTPPTEEIEFGDTLRIIVAAEPLPGYRVPSAGTGTRTDTVILDVPQGIQVIPQAVIEDQGVTSLGESLRNVSGVNAGRSAASGQGTTPIIRGFESNNILRNGLRDDTLRLSSGITNIEQVEILKGPASVLFGAGNLGGTINLITEVPLDEPRYEFGFLAGGNALYRPFLDLTGPFDPAGETAYRFNLAYENRGSFRDFENGEFFFLSPSLQLINTELTSLVADFEFLTNRTRGTAPGLPAVSAIGVASNTLIEDIIEGGGQIPAADLQRAGTLDIRTNLGEPDISYTETRVSRIAYRLEHEFSENWKIRNEFLASFQNTTEDSFVAGVGFVQNQGQPDFSQLNRIYINNPSSREIYTLNTNVVGNFEIAGIDQTLLLGVEWSQEQEQDRIIQRLFLPFLSRADPFNIFEPNYDSRRFFDGTDLNERIGSDSLSRSRTVGLYGQTQLNLSDYLIVLLGGRFDFADQFFQDSANRADPSPISTSDTAFSPRVGVVVKPAENVSLYASYTQSFNPVIGRGEDGAVFGPERGSQIEAGVKADLWGDRL
ncbi:MAG: TonB-dependent receptor, partial [Cyanobacteria bacterium J06638_6]